MGSDIGSAVGTVIGSEVESSCTLAVLVLKVREVALINDSGAVNCDNEELKRGSNCASRVNVCLFIPC
jgi:hypothetical protein